MKIIIDYESSWRNSFLDGSNDKPLPAKGRSYIAASANLNDRKKPDSFKQTGLSDSTIYGVLNRLIGDQRKLYQARQCDNYYFQDIEKKISYVDNPRKLVSWNELVYLRNMTGSFDKESYVGSISTDHWLFNSSFSHELWSVAFADLKELISFICFEKLSVKKFNFDPRDIIRRFDEFAPIPLNKLEELNVSSHQIIDVLKKLTEKTINSKLNQLFPSMKKTFENVDYIKNEKLNIRALYCSSLYLSLTRFSERGELVPSNIKGFSVAGLTPKDFMANFTKGKKKVYGNPYLKKEKVKGKGEIISMLTKASGQLEIEIDVADGGRGRIFSELSRSQEIKQLIENAGVSSFYLGKKGLAYVSKIRV